MTNYQSPLTDLRGATLLSRRLRCVFVFASLALIVNTTGCFGEPVPTDEKKLVEAIFKAAKYESSVRAQTLIEGGAPTNQPDLLGWTPLHYAVNRLHYRDFKDFNLIEVLATAPGTKINAIDNGGLSPVFLAAQHGSTEALDILERHGALLERKDDHGFTLLMTAVAHRQLQMATHLVGKGLDIDARLPTGGTALYIAIRSQSSAMVSTLIELGAGVGGNDQASEPIIFASALPNEDIVGLLIKAGADVNAVNRKTGITPLHRAVASGPEMITLLLKSGAKAGLPDKNGDTPLDLAEKLENEDSIRLLREAR
jgi:ankyrin repeat protein